MPHNDPVRGLTPAGEDVVTRTYLGFINDPAMDVDTYLARSEDYEQAHRTLEILEARGLIDMPGDGSIVVPPPVGALTAFAAEIERQARRLRASASQMGMIHRRARENLLADDDGLSAQLLESIAEIRAATAEIASEAEHSMYCAWANSERTRALVAPDGEDHDRLPTDSTGRPLEIISVYDTSLLEIPGVLDVLRRRQAAGEQVRLAHAIPFSTVVVDEQAAVLDLSNIDERGIGSAALRGGPLITALHRFVRRTFDDGLPMPDPRDGRTHIIGLTERDLVALTLLAAGSSDASVARQLGVSVRTVERRVRHIMETLGTSSRLQTGVEAARRGIV